jgi:glycosyltransferase involved in cell wall biosynthesis
VASPPDEGRPTGLDDLRINIHMPAFWGGGAERAIVRLANHWTREKRFRVRMVVNAAVGPVREHLAEGVDVVDLGALRTRDAFGRLCAWVRAEQPEVLVSVLPSATIATSLAIRLFSRRTAHVALVRNHTTGELAHDGRLRRTLLGAALRRGLRAADIIGCVSRSVADDVVTFAGIAPDRVVTTYNPVPMPEPDLVRVLPGWPEGAAKVLVAAGRLAHQKDYPTLVRAAALAARHARFELVILGEGPLREEIAALAAELGIADRVHLLGFVAAPEDYVARGDVFVLTSLFEGFPNVVAEALSLGRTVIATDAPGGSAEILGDGAYGYVAPMGDVGRIAELIVTALAEPVDPEVARARARTFSVAEVALNYERAIRAAIVRHESVAGPRLP